MLNNKIQPSKCEDLIGFIKQFVNQHPIQQVERCSQELCNVEGLYRKEGRPRSHQPKKRKGCFRQGHPPLGGRAGVDHADELFFFVGRCDGETTDYLIGVYQKIPGPLLRLHFWGKLKLQLGQAVSPGLVTWLSRSDSLLGLWLLFNNTYRENLLPTKKSYLQRQ